MHWEDFFQRPAKVRISGVNCYMGDVLAREPPQAVHQMNARGEDGPSTGEAFVEIPRRRLQEAKVLQDAVPAQNYLTDAVFVEESFGFSQLGIEAMGHTDEESFSGFARRNQHPISFF